MPDEPLQLLRAAADGLYYPSESDAPFEPFKWPRSAGRTARAAVAAHEEQGVPLEEQSPGAFFDELKNVADADRFEKLRYALNGALRDLTVIRAGEVRVAVYLIGRTPAGEWAGLRTSSVES